MSGKINIRLSKNIFSSLEYPKLLNRKVSVFFEYTSDGYGDDFDFSRGCSLLEQAQKISYSGYICSPLINERLVTPNQERVIPIIRVDDLNDPYKCEHFVKRVYLLEEVRRSITYIKNKYDLEIFHRRHKILLRLYHSLNQKSLGNIICAAKYNNDIEKQKLIYYNLFLKSFNKVASIGNHYSILQRVLREINKLISLQERVNLQGVLKSFYSGDIPLSLPINIIIEYAFRYDMKFILEQSYIDLYPLSLKLKDNIRRRL
jgi:uncharacterized protein YbgA (DUF1722 family)